MFAMTNEFVVVTARRFVTSAAAASRPVMHSDALRCQPPKSTKLLQLQLGVGARCSAVGRKC